MAEKEGIYYCPQPGEEVIFAPFVKFWPTSWGNWGPGPFKVASVREKVDQCTCGAEELKQASRNPDIKIGCAPECDLVDPVEVLTLQTPLGKRTISGYWFAIPSKDCLPYTPSADRLI